MGYRHGCQNRLPRMSSAGSVPVDYVESQIMTTAICLQCGARKFGAWTPCRKCQYTPFSKSDRAKSILLSDHHLSNAELLEKSRQIEKGELIEFPDDELAKFMEDSQDEQVIHKPDTFGIKAGVFLIAWVIVAVWILIFVDNLFVKAITGGLLFMTIGPTIAMCLDVFEPLRRICRSCNRRGVTQSTTRLFESSRPYDQWNYCRNCGAVYLQIDGQWVRHQTQRDTTASDHSD